MSEDSMPRDLLRTWKYGSYHSSGRSPVAETGGEKQKRIKQKKGGEKTKPQGHDFALLCSATSSSDPINSNYTAIIHAAEFCRVRLGLLMILLFLGAGAKEAFSIEQRLPPKGKW